MKYAYNPRTGEIINTSVIADWMGSTDAEPPKFNPAIEGCFWANGKWSIVGPDLVAALAEAKTDALQRIDQYHSEVVSRLVGNPTQTEIDTWALKLDTANAITQGGAVGVTGLAFLQSAGLIDAPEQTAWARSVLAKATNYGQVVGVAEKLRDTARAAVKAASDVAGVQATLEVQRTAALAAISALPAA